MSWKSRWLPLATAFAIVSLLTFAAACGDDDDENADEAQDLAGSLEQFSSALLGTTDIVSASDDVRDSLNDNCDELADGTDDDQIDDFCDELEQAIDDEDQQAFEEVKAVYPAVEQEVRAQIASDIGDVAADDDDDDDPLEGGDDPDDGDDSGDDGGDDGDDVPGVDNPIDDDDGDDQ